MQVRAITFDVGGTLIRPWPSVGHVYAGVAADCGLKSISPDVLNRNFAVAWHAKKDFQHTQEHWERLVDQTFAGLCSPAAGRRIFPAAYRRFAEADTWRIHDDALAALDALDASGIPLAVVSNWDERLRPLLDALRLARYFDAIIVSCEVGFTKPSPVMFEQAAKKLGVPPESILHVGDNANEDVAGAWSAGFQALLIDRKLKAACAGQLSSLRQLEGLILTR